MYVCMYVCVCIYIKYIYGVSISVLSHLTLSVPLLLFILETVRNVFLCAYPSFKMPISSIKLVRHTQTTKI